MPIRVQSAKAKGRMFQQEVQEIILDNFPNLEPDDVRSVSMGSQGEDIQLSPKARRELKGVQIECKRRKSFKMLYDYMQQAKSHGDNTPIVVLRQDRSKPLALVEFSFLMELLKNGS